MRPIYVAATGQHVGKTTSTLGLVAAIQEAGIDVGYCKPVGQRHVTVEGLKVDKDVVLFAELMKFDISEDIHSPVIMGSGITADFLDDPSKFNFRERIAFAEASLTAQHDLIVYEGTGHTGVGSVANVSNADVAQQLGAGVVMIVEGGIGRTIDKMNLCLSLFREKNVPILGVIVNKVIPEKIDKIEYYLSKYFEQQGFPLLGVLPYDKTLSYPIMETVKQAVSGKVVLNERYLGNLVEDIIAGSLIDTEEFINMRNTMLVVSSRRLSEAIKKIKAVTKKSKLTSSPLSGVIITGDGKHSINIEDLANCYNYLVEHNIPVISTALDTFGSVVKVSRIEVKINTKTPWKIQRAVELIRENVNLDYLLKAAQS